MTQPSRSRWGVKPLDDWFVEYDVSHRHPINQRLHYICVPAIMASLLGLLWGWKFSDASWMNGASLVALAALFYYWALSRPLALGMGGALLAVLGLCAWLEPRIALGRWSLGLFALAWIGQFIGHRIEGRKPSFFQDLQFLLIGPLWILAKLSRSRVAPGPPGV